MRIVLIAALAAVLSAGSGRLAIADDSAEEALYGRYHQAIEAAKLCRNLTFDQDAHSSMATVIHAKINHKIGAKRLSLLTAAQAEAQGKVERQGCAGDEVTALLALFDADLAPALR